MFFTGLANDLQGVDKKTHRPTKLISQGKQVGYFYDKHGRVKTKTLTPVDKDGVPLKQSSQSIVGYLESLQLFYTPNNELEKSIKIHQQGFDVTTTTTYYYYDAFGRRIGKSSSTQKSSKLNQRGQLVRFPSNLSSLNTTDRPQRNNTLMLWDGNRQIQEITDDFTFTTVYEQNSFVPVARIIERQPHLLEKAKLDEQTEWAKYENMQLTKCSKANIHHKIHTGLRIYHYHTDHLGTPQELTNDRGEVVWLNYQMAWGGSFSQLNHVYNLDGLDVSADELQPFRFQGQFFDGETGLHYNRFRYYDSDVGMFISRDPIGLLGGSNVFQYAPNPVMWIDPWGLSPCHYKEVEKQQLPKQVAESFTDGKYKTVELQQDMTYYRVYGGNAQANGGFVTTNPAVNRIQSKIDSALLPEWGNTRQFEATIVVPKGTIVNIGTVAPQTTKSGTVLSGGADQILLPRGYDSSWIKGSRNVPP